MNYLLDLFTPDTWQAFQAAGSQVTGFRPRQRSLATERVKQGDVFLCYLTRLSRWCGALRVDSSVYENANPLFAEPDPFTIRFKVHPIVVLEPELAIPIHNQLVWTTLSMTRTYDPASSHWTGFFRNSLNKFSDTDGKYIFDLLKQQRDDPTRYPLSERDRRNLNASKVRTLDGEVDVEIPDDDADDALPMEGRPAAGRSESLKMQAKVAHIGAEMGYRIWTPRNDRQKVLDNISENVRDRFLQKLPLNYDDTTLRTIEQIDILWLKGRSIARAFEIEHTTSIYSGLLRMADLLALQPNMDIRLHIVAPEERRAQVLREIKRPVFSLLEKGPLYQQCSYLSYEAINELRMKAHLSHTKDTILAEYEETAEV